MADQEVQTASPEASETQESTQETQAPETTEATAAVENLEKKLESGDLSKKEKKEVAKKIKELKIKYNGKEMIEKLPFEMDDNPEQIEWMTKQLQMSKMGHTKAQEAAELQKNVLALVEELKKNPKRVLSDPNINIDLKALAASIIEEEYANAQKSPEQLEMEKTKAELQELKAQREREKEENRQKKLVEDQQKEFERYDMLMGQALEKSDLPKTPYVVKKMADYMLMGLDLGKELTPQDVLDLVRTEVQSDIKEMFAVMPDEVIERLIDKQVFDRIRKKRVASTKKDAPTPINAAVKDVVKPTDKNPKKDKVLNYKDFFKL